MDVHIYLLFSTVTAIVFYIYLRLSRKIQQNAIPGPRVLPFFGTKWQTIDMTKLHFYYESLNRKYGDTVMEMSGNFPIISIFKREDIEKVLSCSSQYPFRPPNEIQAFYRLQNTNRYSSVGITNEQGPEWQKLRMKLSLRTLENRKFYERFCRDLNDVCAEFIDGIRQIRNERNEIRNFHDNLRSFSFETNCFFVLGKRGYGSLEDDTVAKLTDANVKIMECIRDTYYGTQFWKYFPSKTYKTFAESEELIYDIINEIIQKILNEDKDKASDTDYTSILEKVINSDGLDMKDKICGIVDFLSGSTEAKTATIIFLLNHLTNYPEVQNKIYQEAMALNEFLTIEDIRNAHYTRAALYETFRLTPTVPCIARMIESDLELTDFTLKQGDANFEDGDSFRPERWLNSNGEFDLSQIPGSSIVLPFGTGKRACPGRKFAEIELQMILIKLVRAFRIQYNSPFEKAFKFIMTPEFPVHMVFDDRD